jgi:hypothetical protein
MGIRRLALTATVLFVACTHSQSIGPVITQVLPASGGGAIDVTRCTARVSEAATTFENCRTERIQVAAPPTRTVETPAESAREMIQRPQAELRAPTSGQQCRIKKKLSDGAQCGTERWPVKVGCDEGASRISLAKPQAETIAFLRGIETPDEEDDDGRLLPVETTAYMLKDVSLTDYFEEPDGDYHLVLTDHDKTMIAEIPHPDCMVVWRDEVAAVRKAFDDQHNDAHDALTNPHKKHHKIHDLVSLVGIGFFDKIHGQSGVAPNGIELHPVVRMCFGAHCSLD